MSPSTNGADSHFVKILPAESGPHELRHTQTISDQPVTFAHFCCKELEVEDIEVELVEVLEASRLRAELAKFFPNSLANAHMQPKLLA